MDVDICQCSWNCPLNVKQEAVRNGLRTTVPVGAGGPLCHGRDRKFPRDPSSHQAVYAVEKHVKCQPIFQTVSKSKDVCLGAPCIVGRNGIKKVLEIPLDKEEKRLLAESSEKLKAIISTLNI